MLSFAIALFTVVSIFVLSYPFSTPSPQVDIVSYIDGTDIIWEHHGGPSLDLDTNLSVTISGTNTRFEVSDYIESDLNSNGKWDIGERVIYPAGDMSGLSVDVMVVDLDSNSLLMLGTLQEGSSGGGPTPPSLATSVNTITPYEQSGSPLSLTATGDSDLDNVSLYYRWSNDNSSWEGGIWEENKNAVDNADSNQDGSSDIGTETNFVNAQDTAPDADVMTLVEKNTAWNDFYNTTVTDNMIDKDGFPDNGTENNFANAQDIVPDADVMTITEENKGGIPEINDWLTVSSRDSTYEDWTYRVGTTPYIDTVDDDEGHSGSHIDEVKTSGNTEGWFYFADTSETGSGYTVNFTFRCDSDDGDTDGFYVYYDETGSGSGTLHPTKVEITSTTYDYYSATLSGTFSATEINNMRIYLEYIGNDDVYVDYCNMSIYRASVPITYEMDYEYAINGTNYSEDNENLCFYLTGSVTEDIVVDYWTGSDWSNLGNIENSGWTNLTAIGLTSGNYFIHLYDENQSDEPTNTTWTIDVIKIHTWNDSLYKLDFEYQWTTANYTEDTELVCIYVDSKGSENINVMEWTGTWGSIGTISSTGWNNLTATSLSSDTYTIQFIGSSESIDTNQDTFTIDVICLRTYNSSGGPNGIDWTEWNDASNPDITSPWSWDFNFPNAVGYYEFYSIGKYDGDTETAPGIADAICYYNP